MQVSQPGKCVTLPGRQTQETALYKTCVFQFGWAFNLRDCFFPELFGRDIRPNLRNRDCVQAHAYTAAIAGSPGDMLREFLPFEHMKARYTPTTSRVRRGGKRYPALLTCGPVIFLNFDAASSYSSRIRATRASMAALASP